MKILIIIVIFSRKKNYCYLNLIFDLLAPIFFFIYFNFKYVYFNFYKSIRIF